jgi:hypothetical protein
MGLTKKGISQGSYTKRFTFQINSIYFALLVHAQEYRKELKNSTFVCIKYI